MKQYGIIAETDALELLSVPNLVLKFTVRENSLGQAITRGRIEALKALEESNLSNPSRPVSILRMTVAEIFNEAESVFS
jgi:hypothetical protein